MDVANEHVRVEDAREDFLATGRVGGQAVSDLIAASWRRSVEAGVSPTADRIDSTYVDNFDVRSRFAHCALPVIQRLQQELNDIPIGVVLTDQRSRLLLRLDNDKSLGRRFDSVMFAPGFTYAEDVVGTNAIGTALEAGRAVFIRGHEHFAEPIGPYACAGAPVRDPLTRRIEGVLDLTCLAKDSSPIMRVLVQEAARDIEAALLADGRQQQQVVLDTFMRMSRNSRSSVLSLSGGVFMVDARASEGLSPLDQGRLRETAAELLAARDGTVVDVHLPSGRLARVRNNLVTVGDELAGTVIQVDLRAPSHERPPDAPTPPATLPGAPGNSSAWRTVCGDLVANGRERRPVIVTGEPGSGKATLAAATHRWLNAGGSLTTIDCRDIDTPPGHVLRTALEGREPAIVLTHLDEIGDEHVEALMHQLWHAAQLTPRAWIVATMTDSPSAQREQLNGVLRHFVSSVSVPALRHHAEDLHQLVAHLLPKLAPRREIRCTPDAMRMLLGYSWPGNITELVEALREAVKNRPAGDLRVADLPARCLTSSRRVLTPMESIERDAIVRALTEADGNRLKAAEVLGIARSSLYRKMKTYGIRAGR